MADYKLKNLLDELEQSDAKGVHFHLSDVWTGAEKSGLVYIRKQADKRNIALVEHNGGLFLVKQQAILDE